MTCRPSVRIALVLALAVGPLAAAGDPGRRSSRPRRRRPSPAAAPPRRRSSRRWTPRRGTAPRTEPAGADDDAGPAGTRTRSRTGVSGTRPPAGTRPAASGAGPAASGAGPAASGAGPAASGTGPAAPGVRPRAPAPRAQAAGRSRGALRHRRLRPDPGDDAHHARSRGGRPLRLPDGRAELSDRARDPGDGAAGPAGRVPATDVPVRPRGEGRRGRDQEVAAGHGHRGAGRVPSRSPRPSAARSPPSRTRSAAVRLRRGRHVQSRGVARDPRRRRPRDLHGRLAHLRARAGRGRSARDRDGRRHGGHRRARLPGTAAVSTARRRPLSAVSHGPAAPRTRSRPPGRRTSPSPRAQQAPRAAAGAAASVARSPRSCPALFKVSGAVLGSTTVLTGLLFYFGRLHITGFFRYLRVNFTVLDLTPNDYLIRSADGLFVPLTTAAVTGPAGAVGQPVRVPASVPRTPEVRPADRPPLGGRRRSGPGAARPAGAVRRSAADRGPAVARGRGARRGCPSPGLRRPPRASGRGAHDRASHE